MERGTNVRKEEKIKRLLQTTSAWMWWLGMPRNEIKVACIAVKFPVLARVVPPSRGSPSAAACRVQARAAWTRHGAVVGGRRW